MEAIKSSEQLLARFGVLDPDYFDVSTMPNKRIGFIAFREFPTSLRYKPPLDRRGRPALVSLLRVALPSSSTDSTSINKTDRRRPLLIQARLWPRGEQERSEPREKAAWEPIDLDFRDDYWVDLSTNVFETKKGQSIAARAILEDAFKTHCGTSRLIPRMWYHLRLTARAVLAWFLALIAAAMILLLKMFLGQDVQPVDKDLRGAWEGAKWISRERLLWPLKVEIATDVPQQPDVTAEIKKEKTLQVFNYEAPRAVAVTFSALALCMYSVTFFSLDRGSRLYSYLKGVLGNPMLSLAAGVLGIFVLDYVIPQLGVRVINSLQRARMTLYSKPLKI